MVTPFPRRCGLAPILLALVAACSTKPEGGGFGSAPSSSSSSGEAGESSTESSSEASSAVTTDATDATDATDTSDTSDTSDTTDTSDTSDATSADGTGGPNPSSCPAGEVAVGYDGVDLICQGVDTDARAAMNENCQVHFGWRDNCDACTTVPSKYGYAGGSCSVLVGTNSQCTTQTIDGQTLQVLGLNTDGDVNGDDKFYVGFDCLAPTALSFVGANCPVGQYVVGIDAMGEPTCADVATTVSDWASNSCDVYLGWRDSCTNCVSGPDKWGRSGAMGCATGAGTDNACINQTVAGRTVELFGLSTDGDVDETDTFYLSLDCQDAAPATTSDVSTTCPAGQFVTAIDGAGLLTCTDAQSLIAGYARDACHAYIGWRDSCDACTLAPTRWAGSSTTGCGGTSAGARCLQHVVGGTNQWMASVGTDGDVGDDDKFYAAFACR